jgi:hypothetical protein
MGSSIVISIHKTSNSYYILDATTSRNVVYPDIPSPSIFQESLSQLNKSNLIQFKCTETFFFIKM